MYFADIYKYSSYISIKIVLQIPKCLNFVLQNVYDTFLHFKVNTAKTENRCTIFYMLIKCLC